MSGGGPRAYGDQVCSECKGAADWPPYSGCSVCNPPGPVACGSEPSDGWRERGGQRAFCSSVCLREGKHVNTRMDTLLYDDAFLGNVMDDYLPKAGK